MAAGVGYSRGALASKTTLDIDAPRSDGPSAEGPALSRTLAEETAPPTLFERLPSGLTLLLRESHRSPVVELQIWAGVGSADERKGEEGLAQAQKSASDAYHQTEASVRENPAAAVGIAAAIGFVVGLLAGRR